MHDLKDGADIVQLIKRQRSVPVKSFFIQVRGIS